MLMLFAFRLVAGVLPLVVTLLLVLGQTLLEHLLELLVPFRQLLRLTLQGIMPATRFGTVPALEGRTPWSGSLSLARPWSARLETFALALPREAAAFERWSVVWLATAFVVVLAAFAAWKRAGEARPPAVIDPPLAEQRALLAFFALALVGRAAWLALEPGNPIAHAAEAARFAMWSLLPCAALIIGLALVRPERTA